jgi:hypothetical protein
MSAVLEGRVEVRLADVCCCSELKSHKSLAEKIVPDFLSWLPIAANIGESPDPVQ